MLIMGKKLKELTSTLRKSKEYYVDFDLLHFSYVCVLSLDLILIFIEYKFEVFIIIHSKGDDAKSLVCTADFCVSSFLQRMYDLA